MGGRAFVLQNKLRGATGNVYKIGGSPFVHRFSDIMSLSTNLLVLALLFIYLVLRRPRQCRISDYAHAVSFLQKSSFQERATANLHLHRAFGIANPFVIGDKAFHDEYIKLVLARLTHVTRDWSDIIREASITRNKLTFQSAEEIANAVRAVVMTISLTMIDVTGFEIDQLLRAGHLIDVIWTSAKSGRDTGTERDELYSIIRKWEIGSFVDRLARISDVPNECAVLSILIPAYETLYRVVLPILFHSHRTITFAPFTKPDTSYHDLTSESQVGYTYLALVQESLRLYPVVKRIKRVNSWGKISVDIEAIHNEGWENPEGFDPGRWMSGHKGKFMAFGAGRGRCVANERVVGMVVCIVIALIEDQVSTFEKDELREFLDNARGKIHLSA